MAVIKGKRVDDSKSPRKIVISALRGSIIGIVLFFILMLAAARLILNFDLGNTLLLPVAFLCAALASLAAGFICVRPLRRLGLPLGAVCTVPIILAVLIASAVTAGTPGKNMLIAAVVMLAAGALGGIAATNVRKKQGRRR